MERRWADGWTDGWMVGWREENVEFVGDAECKLSCGYKAAVWPPRCAADGRTVT